MIGVVEVTLIIAAIALFVYLRFASNDVIARWMDNASPWVPALLGAAMVVYCVLVMLGVIVESPFQAFRSFIAGIAGILILIGVTIRASNRRGQR